MDDQQLLNDSKLKIATRELLEDLAFHAVDQTDINKKLINEWKNAFDQCHKGKAYPDWFTQLHSKFIDKS